MEPKYWGEAFEADPQTWEVDLVASIQCSSPDTLWGWIQGQLELDREVTVWKS